MLIRRISRVTVRGALAAMMAVVGVSYAEAQTPSGQSTEIRRDPESIWAAIQVYPLRAGGEVKHNRPGGWIQRVDERQKVVARAKVPKDARLDRNTTVVLSGDQSRLLVIHRDDDLHFPAKHKVALLDMATLKTTADLPLGECTDPRGRLPVMADQLTLVCYHSRPPDQPKRKPTIALVTIDLNRGEVVRWFPFGGERHGSWFGPMFFGYSYDVYVIPIDRDRATCPDGPVLPQLESTRQPIEHPHAVVVLARDKGDPKGEVWFVSATATVPPRRVALLEERPTSAAICGPGSRLLYVTSEREAAPAAKSQAPAPAGRIVEVFDHSSGVRIAR